MDGDQLRQTRFFEFLSDEERQEFAEASEALSFAAGEALIEEGAENHSLFVLLSGRVEVCKKVPGGGERRLAEVGANEKTVVGERGLLVEGGASATVRATGEVEAVGIPRETFQAMISEGRPAAYKLAYRIARTLAERLACVDEEFVEALREVERRGETDLEAFREKLSAEWTV